MISKEDKEVKDCNNGQESDYPVSGCYVQHDIESHKCSVDNCYPFYLDRYDEEQHNSVLGEHDSISEEKRQIEIHRCYKGSCTGSKHKYQSVDDIKNNTHKIVHCKSA